MQRNLGHVLDRGTAGYWIGGRQNFGQARGATLEKNCKISDRKTAEYWTGSWQNIGQNDFKYWTYKNKKNDFKIYILDKGQ
jgi:hypothetical protein